MTRQTANEPEPVVTSVCGAGQTCPSQRRPPPDTHAHTYELFTVILVVAHCLSNWPFIEFSFLCQLKLDQKMESAAAFYPNFAFS